MREVKERVTGELLPKVLSVYHDTRVWIDPKSCWLVIDAAASGNADRCWALLAKTAEPPPIESWFVNQPSAAVMTGWLTTDEAQVNFSVDHDTEPMSSGGSDAAIC